MTTKHTPAPWFSQYNDNGFFEIGSEAAIPRLAFTYDESDTDSANASLIAAAPELLDALQRFSDYVHAEQSSTDGAVTYSTTIINHLAFLARDAIARAISPTYNLSKIAWELERTAMGDGHYGNALYVAKDIAGVTDQDRALLDRYATGRNTGTDHVALQDLAMRIDKATGKSNE